MRVYIPVSDLDRLWNIKPNGILHVGAHLAEEEVEYSKHGWSKFGVIWIEAQPALAENLRSILDPTNHRVIEAAAWSENDKLFQFQVASNTASSSLLEFGTHHDHYPDIIKTESFAIKSARLDSILNEIDQFDFVNIDIQGAELHALIGLGHLINKCKWLYLEVNSEQVYKDCALVAEVDLYLYELGFARVQTVWIQKQGWGDALYIKEGFNKTTTYQKIRIYYKYQFKMPLLNKLRVIKQYFKGIKN